MENVITGYSTSQTLTLSTSITSYATTIKSEERYTEDDFETHVWTTGPNGVTIVIANILELSLKEGDRVSIFLSSIYEGSLRFSRGALKVKVVPVHRGDNSYEFAVDRSGNYTILYRVSGGPHQAFPFKATVTVSRLSGQWASKTLVYTSTIKRTETILSTEILTRFSTAIITAPLESGRMAAYALWGLAAAIVAATLTYMARGRFAPGYKLCHKCGAKLKSEAEYCDECGSKVE